MDFKKIYFSGNIYYVLTDSRELEDGLRKAGWHVIRSSTYNAWEAWTMDSKLAAKLAEEKKFEIIREP